MASLPEQLDSLIGSLADALTPAMAEGAASALSDPDLLAATRSAEALGRLVDALRVTLAGEIAHRSRADLGSERLSATHGCRTPAELIERLTLVAGATARARMRAAAPLRSRIGLTGDVLPSSFPLVGEALASGAIGVDAASVIVAALAPLDARGAAGPDDLAAAESELVAAAVGGAVALPVGADELRVMTQLWALYLDPDGTLPDDASVLRRRGLTLGRAREGTVPLRGELIPEAAAQLQRLLDAYLNPRVESPPGGGPTFGSDADFAADDLRDPRTPSQRRHDALAGILATAASSAESPTLGGAAPTLVVTISASELQKQSGVGFLQGTDASASPTAVPASLARRIACAGGVHRLVTGGDGRILELGAPQRLFTAHQRRAIAQRDGGCVIPGCRVPATWCEVHHVHDHARGGPTHIDNGVLLCWHHHHTIGSGGWEIRMVQGIPWVRAPRWLDPDQRWRPSRGSMHRQFEALAIGP